MKALNKESKRAGISGAVKTVFACAIVLAVVAAVLQNCYVFYGMLGLPVMFWLVFCFVYTFKEGMIKFLDPDMVMSAYDNPVDNFCRSPMDKHIGSFVLTAACFLPTCVFYLLFAWIFFLVKA